MVAERGKCLFFCDGFHGDNIRSAQKTAVETVDNFAKCPAIRIQRYAVTESMLFSENGAAANAGNADNRVYKAKDSFNVLDGDYLAEMIFLHFAGNKPSDDGLYDCRGFAERIYFADTVFHLVSIRREEFFDKFLSANVAEQVVRIVGGLKIPFFPFAML